MAKARLTIGNAGFSGRRSQAQTKAHITGSGLWMQCSSAKRSTMTPKRMRASQDDIGVVYQRSSDHWHSKSPERSCRHLASSPRTHHIGALLFLGQPIAPRTATQARMAPSGCFPTYVCYAGPKDPQPCKPCRRDA
jgi:hypothetical protein